MANEMTGRERVKAVLHRQAHDRVPRYESFWPDTIREWEKQGLVGGAQGVFAKLDADIELLDVTWPCPFKGKEEILEQDDETKVVRDDFGQIVRYWKNRSGTPEHIDFFTKTKDIWLETTKPGMLANQPFLNVEQAKKSFAEAEKTGRYTCVRSVEGFEQTRKIIGDETSMIAMAMEPQWIADVSKTHTDIVLRDLELLWDAGVRPDGFFVYGDMAYNHSTVCSPQMYRDLIWPDHKRFVDWAHAHDMEFIFHTDGDINAVIPMYIEAGFDCIQPLEAKANMDVRDLASKHGKDISFFGNINVMVLATGDREKIEEEVRTKIEAGKSNKNYIFHSDHSVPPNVTWETYQFVIELVNQYGSY